MDTEQELFGVLSALVSLNSLTSYSEEQSQSIADAHAETMAEAREILARYKAPKVVEQSDVYTWNSAVANGLLQEVNRRFLHPLGYDLRVQYDELTGNYGGASLHRTADDEGFTYAEINPKFKTAYDIIEMCRHPKRERKLGWIIQE